MLVESVRGRLSGMRGARRGRGLSQRRGGLGFHRNRRAAHPKRRGAAQCSAASPAAHPCWVPLAAEGCPLGWNPGLSWPKGRGGCAAHGRAGGQFSACSKLPLADEVVPFPLPSALPAKSPSEQPHLHAIASCVPVLRSVRKRILLLGVCWSGGRPALRRMHGHMRQHVPACFHSCLHPSARAPACACMRTRARRGHGRALPACAAT